nr:MAG TPA: hypothetical protein [Caudoviricetes sp.]
MIASLFFIWYNIIDKNTHISLKNIRTFSPKLYATIYDTTSYHLKSLIINH